MILIVADADDLHARHVSNLIRARGQLATILDLAEVTEAVRYRHRIGQVTQAEMARGAQQAIDFADLRSIWFRRPNMIAAPEGVVDPTARQFISHEWSEAMNGMVLGQGRTRWVNHPLSQTAATKTLQLQCAVAAGLRIPETLVSNDPKAVRRFVTELQGRVIHKSLTTPRGRLIDTRAWTEAADALLDTTLPLAPAVFQERIDGPADLRVTMFGEDCFAARIDSPDGRTQIDSRLDLDVPYSAYQVPETLRAQLRDLMRRLDLNFGVIDLKVDTEGGTVFLEINPQGQFLFVEILTGMEISAALADYLCKEP